ncbi:phosphoribosyltransferase [Candidatus Kaiserbacteria bacterium]|nr:phosphoribosyltransferase [Candidatus Kaiserbacteria bacterium]
MLYADRTEAGKRLADELQKTNMPQPLVLALARGGVPVALPIARALYCPLDTFVVRKIGAPFNPEFAVGALGPHDTVILDDESIRASGSSRAAVEGVIGKEQSEMRRRIDAYRSGSFAAGYIPKTVIIVDDGIATGLTAKAALVAARARHPKAHIVLVVPICLGDAAHHVHSFADEIMCLDARTDMHAIGQAYGDFEQVADEEVTKILEDHKARLL